MTIIMILEAIGGEAKGDDGGQPKPSKTSCSPPKKKCPQK